MVLIFYILDDVNCIISKYFSLALCCYHRHFYHYRGTKLALVSEHFLIFGCDPLLLENMTQVVVQFFPFLLAVFSLLLSVSKCKSCC